MACDPQPVAQARKRIDEEVGVNGWVSGLRQVDEGLRFELRDRSGVIQAIWPLGEADSLPSAESAVSAQGSVRAGNRSEPLLEVESLRVLGPAADSNGRGEGQASRRRHVELRRPREFKVFAIQTTLEAALREFALANGFIELHTPKISGGGSESGAGVFELPYFGQSAYLVQSPQFYMQMAMVSGFERVFEIGPVFRYEPGKSPLHATEFTIAHFEMSWIESPADLMDFEEALLRHALAAVADAHGTELEEDFDMPAEPAVAPPPRLSLTSVLDSLSPGKENSELAAAERALLKRARQDGHDSTFVTDYPAAARPFYTMRKEEGSLADGSALSQSFDLLWRGIEITSGGQREHRFDRLEEQIRGAGISERVCDEYIRPHFLEMFRDGAPPHGGFGIGINRLLMAVLGCGSLKETSFVFRGPGQCVP